MADISGRWIFSEEFDCGTDNGFADIEQHGNHLSACFEYEECIDEEEPFTIRQHYTGTIDHNRITLVGQRVTDTNNIPFEAYNPDTLEGTYTSEGKIVGHSYDSANICGVFILTRP